MENGELELNALSLEESENVASSLEDIYGYHVLSEEFEEQVNNYNALKKREYQMCMEYVFTQTPDDEVMKAFQKVMYANTSTVIGKEYEDIDNRDSPFLIIGCIAFGAVLTGAIWTFIEKLWKRKVDK